MPPKSATRPILALAVLLVVASGIACTSETPPRPEEVFEDAGVLKATGYRHLGTGRIDLAINTLRKARQKDPKDEETIKWLAAAYLQAGRDKQAIEVLSEGIEANPDAAELLDLRGFSYLRQKRYLEAVEDLEHALDPDLQYVSPPSTWVNLAEALWGAGRLDGAIDAYRQAIIFQPSNPLPRLALIRALEEKGDHAEALSEAQQLVFLQPGDARAHFALGRVHLSLGQNEKALSSFKKSLELAPAGPSAADAHRYVELLEKRS